MKNLIGVIGGSDIDSSIAEIAFQTGVQIAEYGFGLVCGGMGGVMEQAARGCRQKGGLTVGILPGEDFSLANPYLDVIIPTGMNIARNILIVRSALGIIAIDGKYGTLSELAYALQMHKPIVGIKTWDVSEKIIRVQSPKQAMETLIQLMDHGKSR